jgi:hypothetical protein
MRAIVVMLALNEDRLHTHGNKTMRNKSPPLVDGSNLS